MAEHEREFDTMSMTPENATRSWRELADQLTPRQVAELGDSEQGYGYRATLPKQWWSTEPRSDHEIGGLLLNLARGYARNNLVAAMVDDVALPAGVSPDVWQEGTPQSWRVIPPVLPPISSYSHVPAQPNPAPQAPPGAFACPLTWPIFPIRRLSSCCRVPRSRWRTVRSPRCASPSASGSTRR